MDSPQPHPFLEALKPVVDGIAQTFGPDCEVVLHDLRRPQRSLIKIANNITGRAVGAPIRDLVVRVLRSKHFKDDVLTNYRTETGDGRICKSSTMLIRDENGEPLAALCVNVDLEKFLMARKFIDDFAQARELSEPDDQEVEVEDDVWCTLDRIVARVTEDSGVPVSAMQKDDKVRIVGFLDDKGVFLVKGAVDHVADVLRVSRYTIYNYIEEARVKRRNQGALTDRTWSECSRKLG